MKKYLNSSVSKFGSYDKKEVADEINRFVEMATKNKIKDMVNKGKF